MRIWAIIAVVGLAGCSSAPIVLKTEKGQVTCQNYLKNMTLWDGSISRDSGITKEYADLACRQKGLDDQYQAVEDRKLFVQHP